MHIVPLFSSPIGWDDLKIPLQPIEDFCYKQEQASTAFGKEVGWQSGFLDLNAPELSALINEVNLKISEVNQLYQIKPEHEIKLTNAWININRPNGRNMQNNILHLHPGKFISFVFYVKVKPNCGDLTLISPLNESVGYAVPDQIYKEFNMFNSLKWIMSPEAGKLLMFPSWIQHAADSNNSDEDRISIAFNAELQNLQLIFNPENTI